jgi:hypothetical protein
MNDSNRAAAQEELKRIIASAYGKNELWTTDWSKIELERPVTLCKCPSVVL